jgi:hypothetical protein
MAFIEEGEVAYTMINGKKVPVVKCETEVVLRNKETNQEYNSDAEAEADMIKVAAMPPLGAFTKEL